MLYLAGRFGGINLTVYKKMHNKHHSGMPVICGVMCSERNMNWLKQNRKAIFYWCIILAIAPLFVEIILIAQIMGAETAVAFLLLLLRELRLNWQVRLYQINQLFASCIKIIQNHPICQANVYFCHVTGSVVALVVTGSLTYSVLVWYPVAIIGDKVMSLNP